MPQTEPTTEVVRSLTERMSLGFRVMVGADVSTRVRLRKAKVDAGTFVKGGYGPGTWVTD